MFEILRAKLRKYLDSSTTYTDEYHIVNRIGNFAFMLMWFQRHKWFTERDNSRYGFRGREQLLPSGI